MIRLVIFNCLFFLSLSSFGKTDFLSLFKSEKPIIAAIMVEKDLSSDQKVTKALLWCLEQIKIAEKQGMDGILFEFRGGKIMEPEISPEQFKTMKRIARYLVRSSKKLVVGVEILWHYPEETIRLAHESGAAFVRLDFFVDEVIADKKKVPIAPEKIIAYKNKIGAYNLAVLTDIQVKYSQMVDPKITLTESARKAVSKGSDGLIVTSTKSGRAPTVDRPKNAKKGAGSLPVVIGSGFSYNNAGELLKYADAAIVGTSISVKTGGPLVPEKVEKLMKEVKKVRMAKSATKKKTL